MTNPRAAGDAARDAYQVRYEVYRQELIAYDANPTDPNLPNDFPEVLDDRLDDLEENGGGGGSSAILVAHFAWQRSDLNDSAYMPTGIGEEDPRVVSGEVLFENGLNLTPEALNVPGGAHYVNEDYDYGYADHPIQSGYPFVFRALPRHQYSMWMYGDILVNWGTVSPVTTVAQMAGTWGFYAEPSYDGDGLGYGYYGGFPQLKISNATETNNIGNLYHDLFMSGVRFDFIVPDSDPAGWFISVAALVPYVRDVNGEGENEYHAASVRLFECSIYDHGEQLVTFPT